jgi:aspartyl-tRNA(Asn)/glutamyl-tRNA(Gln) amidotransferase subunit A
MELKDFTIKEIHESLLEKKFSVFELVSAYLEKIKKENEKTNSYLAVYPEKALVQAKKIDEKIAKKEVIPMLAGIPIAMKDNILVEGMQCTAGSKVLKDYVAPYDATCISKLKEQGAIILGKTNLDEFAMGSSTENSAFGPTKNPRDLTRVPGGSSGGSAASVAANLSVFALGSDTGGSIRQPVSFCGLVGLKPTYGMVSRYGLIAFASSLDQIGPITKTVEDCKIVFDAIKGKDKLDSTSVSNKQNVKKVKDLVIGIPKEYFVEGADPKVIELVKERIEQYKSRGIKIKEISLPYTEYALPCYYIIAPSEASANLARYDGIKYGFSATKDPSVDNLMDVYLKSRGEGFGKEVRRRIIIGTYALSSGYYDAYYLRAQKVKKLIKKDFDEAFKKVDAIFTPTSPTTAFKIGERSEDPLKMYLSDIFTVSVNLAGLPAISVPCGNIDGLPVGFQVIGKPFEEERIMEIAGMFKENI